MARQLINPFTPSFGGLPEHFFGRQDVIEMVLEALENPSSPHRSLFITGTRGCGKTALLEQLSERAKTARWATIDVHSSQAATAIAGQLGKLATNASAALSPSVTLPGGVSLSVGKVDLNDGNKVATLSDLLLAACSSLVGYRGIFITIDEVQKIPESDMEGICAAVQMSSRKGFPIAVMLAGLPEAKPTVAAYRGCTFMQRVPEVQLGSLLITETTEAFADMMALVPDVDASKDIVWGLSAMSQGYPYLVQLVGYEFVEHMRREVPLGVARASEEDIFAIEEDVYVTYRKNVLVPSTKRLGAQARTYLAAMSGCLNENGFASSRDVANAMGKTLQQLSSCRQLLLDRRLILAAGRGKLCYGLPYLSRYALEGDRTEPVDLSGRWIPR